MSLLYRKRQAVEERAPTSAGYPTLAWQQFMDYFRVASGGTYAVTDGTAGGILRQCGPAYSVLDRRAAILGEARPMFQRLEKGRPTELFSTPALAILEQPWPGGTFRQLVDACELDVAACGNSYWVRRGDTLVRIEPSWVTIVTAEVEGMSMERGKPAVVGEVLLGYAVQKPGYGPTAYTPDQLFHYRPSPSTESQWRGESWLAAVAQDATSDAEMTRYKANYLRNGAMPGLAVTYDGDLDMGALEEFVKVFQAKFVGASNAGKVMHLLGGRDVKTVGSTLEDLAFKAVQGAGETRIAAAAGVPAVVAGFSEGMQGSSLNAGNYVATRRLFADAKIRPLWGHLFAGLANLVPPPPGSRLWYDDSQVSFVQEDIADEANIKSTIAQTIRTYIEAGFDPVTVVPAVTTGDYSLLRHTGNVSVQLQPPTSGEPPAPQPVQEGNDDAED